MLEQLLLALQQNGYLILFILVFIQELGVPTISNELILLYFGYLCSQFFYSISLALIIGILADVLGSIILFSLFYLFSNYLSNSKIKFIKKIFEKIKYKQEEKKFSNNYSLFFGRLIPYVRGYVSVFAGISKFSYHIYALYLLGSAIIFTGGLILLGYVLGNQLQFCFNKIESVFDQLKYVVLTCSTIFLGYLFLKIIISKKNRNS